MTNPDALQTTIGHSLAFFRSQKNYRYNGIFLEPVDPNLFPSYCRFCQTPMDLFNMKKKWDAGKYNVDDEGAAFWADVRLIVDNCQAYNSRPVGVDNLTEKDYNYVNRVITGFRKLIVAERQRFATRLVKEREKVSNVMPVRSNLKSFQLNLSPNASRSSPVPQQQPANPSKLTLTFGQNTTRKTYTPMPFTPAVRSRCLRMFSLIRRINDPALEVLKKSCRSRKDYVLKIDWRGPDGLKEVEAKCRLTGSEVMLQRYKKGDFSTSPSDLANNSCYKYLHEVVMDTRRGVSNKVRVMCGEEKGDKENRDIHCDALAHLESYFAKFLGVPGEDYPALMDEWRNAMETTNQCFQLNVEHYGNMVNASEWFRHPVTSFFGGVWPMGYLDLVARPMDFGTVTTKVMNGEVQSIKEYRRLCNIIFTNCQRYYSDKAEANQYVPLAMLLRDQLPNILQRSGLILTMNKRGGKLKYDSEVGDQEGDYLITRLPLKHLLESLCNDTFDDPATRKTHKTMDLFERPYEEDELPGYTTIIENPICLKDIRNRVSRDGYRTPEAFEDDVYRIFDNCIKYLGHNFKPLYLKYAESGQKAFRKLYGAWAKKIKERNPNYVTVLSASKKQLAQAALTALNQGNISTSQVGGSPDRGGNPNSMSYSSISPVPGDSGGGSHVPQDINGIAESIKFQHQGTLRDINYLHPWEQKCLDFFNTLKKHEWLSGKKYTKPPLFFSVPVISVWTDPYFVQSYLAKIARPMDLTTLECRLLKGDDIRSIPHFLNEVMLIFDNCMLANQDGMKLGETDPVAYYAAGKLLCDYVRYVSIQFFDAGEGGSEGKGIGKIEYNDPVGATVDPNRPRWSWDFSDASKRAILGELDSKFLHEDPHVSGWVSTEKSRRELKEWPEKEILKIIKILKSNKYAKDMQMFKAPRYPNNYDMYVERRCDLYIVDEKLSERNYTSYNGIVTDLQLIFANAITYNGNFKEADPASMYVYEAAERMQPILEGKLKELRLAAVEHKGRKDIEIQYERNTRRDKDAVKIAAKAEADEARFTKPADKTAKLIEIVQNHELGQAPAESQEGVERKKELEALKRKLVQEAKEKERLRVEEEVRAIKEAEQKAKEEGTKLNLPAVVRRREVDFSMLQDSEAEIEARENEEAKRRKRYREIRDDTFKEWLGKRNQLNSKIKESRKEFVEFLVASGSVEVNVQGEADKGEDMDLDDTGGMGTKAAISFSLTRKVKKERKIQMVEFS